MTPPPRPDPRIALLVCAAILATAAAVPTLDARLAASARPDVPAAQSPAPAPAPPAAPGDPVPGPGDPVPGIDAAATGWRSPTGVPVHVVRGFEPPATPYGAGHRGVDLYAPAGAAVRAAGAGVVTFAGPVAGRGVVVVSHGWLRTTYEPVTAAVAVGQRVRAGDVIGHTDAGHPGCPGGCLHWGLRRGDVYLDPLSLLRASRPRLLPLGDPAP